MLYTIIKFILSLGVQIFYRKITTLNKDLIPKKGPFIIVSNHPNTFMDPFIIGMLTKQHLHFLTQGGIFTRKVYKFFFKKLNMIPIYRAKDKTGTASDNFKIFDLCYKFLNEGGCLLIFPEGSSYIERNLRKIKTGTARITFGAEALTDFNSNIRLVPIGLNYENPIQFRSDIFIRVGKEIHIKDYKALYESNPVQAVKELTEEIRKRISNLIIIAPDESADELAKNIEEVYKQTYPDLVRKKTRLQDEHILSKKIFQRLEYIKTKDPNLYGEIASLAEEYFDKLDQLDISNSAFNRYHKFSKLNLPYLLLLFPIYIYGIAHNLIPYLIPRFLTTKITKDLSYFAPLALIIGLISFCTFYTGYFVLFREFVSKSPWLSTLYLASLPITGLLSFNYSIFYTKLKTQRRMTRKFRKNRDEILELGNLRIKLIEKIKLADEKFLSQ